MHRQNWQEPLIFDWAGEHGPPLTEEDIFNSDIYRILRNEFHPPFEVREYVKQKPWWIPRDPNGSNLQQRSATYIPGKHKNPQYPRLSNLTKVQHLSGLKVLSPIYGVQPWAFPLPEQNDFLRLYDSRDIYEKELKEYRLWARKCWIDGDCFRTLHPEPLLETVYDAQFQLKKNEIQALPHEYLLNAQISLPPREDAFIMTPIKDLKSVDVNTLPLIHCPRTLEEDDNIMRHCEVPVPCRRHPTKFILPNEHSVTTLPLPEVNRQLARYAIENGATIIASEKALQCLLEYEQAWKLPVYVEEVVCPGGGVQTVVVIGSELYTQKECGAQRTFKAFRHLLRTTFTRSNENSQVNSLAHQPATVADSARYHSAEASQSNSRNEDVLQIDVIEQLRRSIEQLAKSYAVTNKGNAPSDAGIAGGGDHAVKVFGSLPEKCGTIISYKYLLRKKFLRSKSNSSNGDDQQIDVSEQRRRSMESAVSYDGTTNSNAQSDAGIENYQTEADKNAPKIYYFGADYDEEPALENILQTQAQADVEVAVPHKQQNQKMMFNKHYFKSFNFVGIRTEIDKAQNSEQFSFDTTTLHEAINDLTGENPSSREDVDYINCTCKETYQTEAEKNAPKIYNFGADSDEEPALGNILQTQAQADVEVAVPHKQQNQKIMFNKHYFKSFNFAGIRTEIDKIQKSEQFSFDTTTLHEAINDLTGENPSSREDVDDINCTCKENYQTEAEKNAPKIYNFGADSDEEPALENILQTQAQADVEVAVPHEEQNQNTMFNKRYFKSFNFAGLRTEIDKAQNSEQFSFDTTTLHEAINDLIGENPSLREDVDDINCTCKGTKFELPPPRSFKKWQVKNAATNRSFDLIVHCSHQVRLDNKEAILEPIVEWQPELGASKQSAGRLRALALALMIRPEANLINVRVDYKNGNMIVIDKLDEERFTRWHGDKRSEIAGRLYSVIEKLHLLMPGQHILEHDSGHGAQAMIYSALPAGASGAHTMSLRPDKDTLTEAEEAAMSKNIYFELSRAMLPYHKDQGILPLAFTTEKKDVKKKYMMPLVRVKIPPPAMPVWKKTWKMMRR